MRRVLAIGAHADDIEFYAGGTLAKMAGESEIIYVIATDGRNGTHGETDPIDLIQIRKEEQEKAAKLLGIKEVIQLGFTDGELEFCLKKLKKNLLEIIVKQKPEIIFSFDPERQYVVHEDFHPDHRAIALAVMDLVLVDATLPTKGGAATFRPRVYLYNSHRPNTEIDVSEQFVKKNQILSVFGSQEEVVEKQKNSQDCTERFRIYQDSETGL